MNATTAERATIRTVMHVYRFNINPLTASPEELQAYDDLHAKLKAEGLRCFSVLDIPTSGSVDTTQPALDRRAVDLETSFLFNNQWNTAPLEGISDKGLRVFDWYETHAPHNPHYRRGHWLEQTEEMRAIRRDTSTCGYCGRHEPTGAFVFCPHCLDSQYLKPGELPLLRMVPVYLHHSPGHQRPELTEEERAELLPKYQHAQIYGATERGRERITKARAAVVTKYRKAIETATIERDAAGWILDHCPGVFENWLYYEHTGRHCFGWRTPLDAETASHLLDLISEFPFPYDIKRADGPTLSGER